MSKRRVFISFLGNTNYVLSYYSFKGETIKKPTRFIQMALLELVCKDWGPEDQIYIFCTNEAYEANWEDKVQFDSKRIKVDEFEDKGLHGYLERWKNDKDAPLLPNFETVPIKPGFSVGEIWEIFNAVYEKLQPKDQIYFDITNAFRSIPLLASVLFDYAKVMNKTEFKAAYYGAFEKLGYANEVRQWTLDKRVAPIVDMTEVIRLQENVQMAKGVTEYGRLNQLAKVLSRKRSLKAVGHDVLLLDKALSTGLGDDLAEGAFIHTFSDKEEAIKSASILPTTKEVLLHVFDGLKGFKEKGKLGNLLAAANWAYKYRMMSLAYTFGKEYINRVAAEKLKAFCPYRNPEGRDFLIFVNAIFALPEKNLNNNNLDSDIRAFSDLINEIIELEWVKNIRNSYKKINDNRNIIDHCKLQRDDSVKKEENSGNNSNKSRSLDYDTLVKEFRKHFKKCVTILRNAPIAVHNKKEKQRNLFINVSDRSWESWSNKQKHEAAAIRSARLENITLIDLPFDPIPTDFKNSKDLEKKINEIVNKQLNKILNMAEETTCTVHVMGDPIMTHQLVSPLKKRGYLCVSSIVDMTYRVKPDGTIGTNPKFIAFHKY